MATPSPRSTAKSGKKRKLEYTDVSEVTEPTRYYNANTEGVITAVSPQMISSPGKKPYYEGTISDGRAKRRLAGFTENNQKILQQHLGQPVSLTNCKAQSNHSDEIEFTVADNSGIVKSKKPFNIPKEDLVVTQQEQTQEINLCALKSQQSVTFVGKVITASTPKVLDDGRQLQNVIVADSSGSATLTLWENWIPYVECGKSYEFKNLKVKEYSGDKTLYTPRQGLSITQVDHFKNVVSVPPTSKIASRARVLAVANLKSVITCVACKCHGQVTTDVTTDIAHCTRCGSRMLLTSCRRNTQAMLTIEAEDKVITLGASGSILAEIASSSLDEEINELQLLKSPQFTIENVN